MRITSALLSSVLDGQQLFGKRRKMLTSLFSFLRKKKTSREIDTQRPRPLIHNPFVVKLDVSSPHERKQRKGRYG